MLVVSDASPINILIRIGHIQVLEKLFREVLIPESVAEEMSRPATPQIVRDWISHPPHWFSVRTPSSPAASKTLRHRGERDAMTLAKEVGANAILLDEERARHEAVLLGLTVIGTVGVLERAADQGIITDLKAAHDALRMTNFRVSDKLLADSLSRYLSKK